MGALVIEELAAACAGCAVLFGATMLGQFLQLDILAGCLPPPTGGA